MTDAAARCTGDDSCKVSEHWPDPASSGPHRGTATAADEVLTDVPDDAPPYSDSYEWQPATAAAHNLEHGSDVIKVTTPATAVCDLCAKSEHLRCEGFPCTCRCWDNPGSPGAVPDAE